MEILKRHLRSTVIFFLNYYIILVLYVALDLILSKESFNEHFGGKLGALEYYVTIFAVLAVVLAVIFLLGLIIIDKIFSIRLSIRETFFISLICAGGMIVSSFLDPNKQQDTFWMSLVPMLVAFLGLILLRFRKE